MDDQSREQALIRLAIVAFVCFVVLAVISALVEGDAKDFWEAARPWVVMGLCFAFVAAAQNLRSGKQ